jgi:hypothetical protein
MNVCMKRSRALALIGFCLSILVGCGKDASPQTVNAKVPTPAQVPDFTAFLPKRVDAYYGDGEGNRIDPRSRGDNPRASYYCADPSDPDINPYVTFDSIKIKYSCDADPAYDGYSFTVTWTMSTSFNLVRTSPFNNSWTSRGRLRLRDGTPTPVYSNNNINPVTIQTLGPDANNPGHTLFRVSYTLRDVPRSTYDTATKIENYALIYTDCSDYPSLAVPISTASTVFSDVSTQPCNRVDRIYINPPSSTNYGSISGCDPMWGMCYPFDYYRPENQEVIFTNTSTQQQYPFMLTPLETRSIPFAAMPKGTYKVKYRNVMPPNAGNCQGPWSPEETWTWTW